MRVVDGDRQADPRHDRQVDDIVAHVGDLDVVVTGGLLEVVIGGPLVALALQDMLDPETLHADAHDL